MITLGKKGSRTALVAAVLALEACGARQAGAPTPVTAAGERYSVRLQSIPDLKPVAATITSRDIAEARSRIGGTIVRLGVKEGDLVQRGEVIAVVADSRIGLETQAYDAQVEAATAQNLSAQAELARTHDLYDHGVYAKARLDQVEAAAKAAAGALNAARSQRAASAERGAQGAIVAPSDGRVLKADVPAGSVVAPGQSVATLTSGPLVLRVEVPEADAAGLKVGQAVELAQAGSGAIPTNARISQVYPAVSAGKVSLDLAAPGVAGDLIGRRLAMRLALGQRQALVIPARFVVTRSGVDYAQVVGPGGGVDQVPIEATPGPEPGQVEVLSGLANGDVLIAPGARR
jgi:RND family efflux transporter MFP subunit